MPGHHIIVGGGLAGLTAAMKLAEQGEQVDLFSIVPVKRSHSVCAQGGINGAVNTKGDVVKSRIFFGKASDYTFFCAIPGHRAAGMQGTVHVTGPTMTLAQAEARDRAEGLRPVFNELSGLSSRKIAAELNERKVATPTGGHWSAMTVIRIRRRLAAD